MNENVYSQCLNKTEILQESAVLPQTRFRDINRNLQALDLDNSRRFNPFMAAFGVRVSSTPLTVEGHRRGAPQVIYSDAGGRGGIINIDSRNVSNLCWFRCRCFGAVCSWRSEKFKFCRRTGG
ncbi:unnamed protein product [Gongylonema pulchrum]|uniref:Plug domain-containing protein n=1 Tax=Gongylonema pulchrum TaxID=637853 RepID=A0A183EZX0_9BILA|nr:unnamed protein product [Gongylonema pulchrum]